MAEILSYIKYTQRTQSHLLQRKGMQQPREAYSHKEAIGRRLASRMACHEYESTSPTLAPASICSNSLSYISLALVTEDIPP